MQRLHLFAVAGAAALALSACGDDDADREVATTNMTDVGVVPVATYTLTPEQQQRRDALNMADYQTEYRSYVDAMGQGATPTPTGTSTATPSAGSMAGGDNGGNMAGTMSPGLGGGVQGDDFASLDRNNDGKLSVAEWAIYDVNLNPNVPKPNDQVKPYATAEQLNTAADGFFSFDRNGDTYLQEDEFQTARSSRPVS